MLGLPSKFNLRSGIATYNLYSLIAGKHDIRGYVEAMGEFWKS